MSYQEMSGKQLADEFERAISDGYTVNGTAILHFEYVPEDLWEEIRARLTGERE